MSFQIAIDGPAGAGKSTVARAAASKLDFLYVDTGAMYRAMGLYFLDQKIDTDDEALVSASLDGAEIELKIEDGEQHVYLNGEDVSSRIRTEEAGMIASKTSAYADVRARLVELQKQIAENSNVIMDGRDIGTVVLPNAPLKIFLTASVKTRAMRRYKELFEKRTPADLKAIEADIERRDYQDTHRENSPLMQAKDAVLLDTSHMNAAAVINSIVTLAKERMGLQ
ncbi:MAG: (d)CMP kinase [Eubacterium sp.]|nr:(d)CMP kinase [Eubacterium sp.]